MSLGEPVNWSSPSQSPAAQPEYFRYQGEGYVRMGDGTILSKDNYLSRQSALQRQSWIDAANRYDPSASTQAAARAMQAPAYKSPTTNQPVTPEQFFAEHRQLDTQARARDAASYQQQLANAGSAWDTPLPRGVTVDMIPTGGGAFTPAPSGGALAPLRSPAEQRAGFTPLPRSAAVTGEALRQPVNLGVKPPGQPLLAKPGALSSAGQGVLYGGGAAAATWMGGAGFWEGAGAGLGGIAGGGLGGLAGAATGGAAGGALGTIPAPIVGTVSGATVGGYLGGAIGAGVGSGIGSSLGGRLGRFIDNLIPDLSGGSGEYPNELDPAAMDAGPVITPGVPFDPRDGGNFSLYGGVVIRYYSPNNGRYLTNSVVSYSIYTNEFGTVIRYVTCTGLNVPDGGLIDTSTLSVESAGACGVGAPFNPEELSTPPTRSANPARQSSPGAAPRTLPPPIPQPTPTAIDRPWPSIEPQSPADTTPLAPPDSVPNFSPTTTPDQATTTTPESTPTPTDLESPSETPSNLPDNPLTPPVDDPLTPVREPKRIVWPGLSAPSFGGVSTSPLAVAIPVVLLDGLRQKVNTPTGSLINRTQPNPNLQVVKPPPAPTVNIPQPSTCAYERQRVMDIQNKATDVQAQASNPTSGFLGLYGIGIESRLKLGQTFDLLGNVNQFMRKAWETTRIQKVLDLLTFVGVMHNVSMLSRDVGETFFYVLGQALDIVGIDKEDGSQLDIGQIVGTSVNNYVRSVLGDAFVDGVRASYQKANRIVQSASMVIWTIRSISDSTQDLLEWVAENTGKIGNALLRFGVVGERAYKPMSERAQAQHRMRNRFSKLNDTLENADDVFSSASVATSNILEIQDETGELLQNWQGFKTSVVDAVPDPWLANQPVETQIAAEATASVSPEINRADAEKTF